MMKRFAYLILIPMLICSSPAITWAVDYDFALSEIKNVDKVLSGVWENDHTILKIGAKATGSNRDEFAEYICKLLVEHSITGIEVQVIDIVAAYSGKVKILGSHKCP